MNWARWERPVLTVLVLAIVAGAWELGVRISGIPSYLLPSLSESVVTAITEAEEILIPAALLTLEVCWRRRSWESRSGLPQRNRRLSSAR